MKAFEQTFCGSLDLLDLLALLLEHHSEYLQK
jgi:hypothetical protein